MKKKYYYPQKNKNVVANQYKNYLAELNNNLPAIYACMVLALSECTNMDNDDIEYIVKLSQKIWMEHEDAPSKMLQKCYEKTGIALHKGNGWDND